jgi:diguanylate cyclase (GGDEF)-like protein
MMARPGGQDVVRAMNPEALGAPAPRAPAASRAARVPALTVLTVEDNPADAVLVREMLREDGGARFSLVHAATLADALAQLDAHRVDCVLLDLSLPDAQGLEALGQIHAAALEVPVVVLSGRDDEAVAIRAVHEGAQDYLVKGHIDPRLLIHTLSYAIERKRAEAELAHRALHDALTGLPNRALLYDRLAQAVSRAGRRGQVVAVLFCDLDRFKLVNDSLGHGAGDQLLVAVAWRLQELLRAGDTAARFGGDEFVVLCEDVGGESHAIAVAERITDALEAPFVAGGEQVFVRASIGIALAADPRARPEALIRDADAAMYRAKERMTSSYEVFDGDLRARTVVRMQTEHALHRALVRGELTLHYQPQVQLASGAVSGVEALVRWEHPERGLLGPEAFIPAAEETGLIVPLGLWVLETACRQSALWAARRRAARGDTRQVTMGVNLSPRQCSDPAFVGGVADVLERTGVPPGSICLEITESAVMEDGGTGLAVLAGLKELGVLLAIDDFGTGCSSLRALQRFPVDVLKIDRSFVRGIESSAQEWAIVAAFIGLAHAFGLTAVAKGVEHIAQVDRLRALGCDEAQGYYFSGPQPPEQLGGLLGSLA